jgi:hypothetical protein
VPAGEVPRAAGERLEPVERLSSAAVEVGAEGADARRVQRQDVLLGRLGGELRDAQEPGPELGERRAQPPLVERLERAGDDGAAGHAQVRGARAVVGDGEGPGHEPLVGDQREPRVEDVQVRIEERGHRGAPRARWRAPFVRFPQMRIEHHWLERLRERS